MFGVVAIVEYPAEHLGVQRFDAPAEERREAGQILDVAGRYPALLQEGLRPTGRIDLDAALREAPRQVRAAPVLSESEKRAARCRPRASSGKEHLRLACQLDRDDRTDAGVARRHAVDTIGHLHRLLVVRYDQHSASLWRKT